jgi:hypothetical protein
LGCEVVEPSSPVVAADVGVRRVPVPAGGDRRRGALLSAVQPNGHAKETPAGHYELSLDAPPTTRVAAAFTELVQTI